ncbi:hypothetical protein EV360DRAFT_73840 [Lentinula raphanica]|nr:hypothetical protein EV360DRAFT_73840 [Lentinula raphanica]
MGSALVEYSEFAVLATPAQPPHSNLFAPKFFHFIFALLAEPRNDFFEILLALLTNLTINALLFCSHAGVFVVVFIAFTCDPSFGITFPKSYTQADLAKRPPSSDISEQAEEIFQNYLQTLNPTHLLRFDSKYSGPGIEGTNIEFELVDSKRGQQCSSGCAGTLRVLGDHYFGKLFTYEEFERHDSEYPSPDSLVDLGTLGPHETSLVGEQLRKAFTGHDTVHFLDRLITTAWRIDDITAVFLRVFDSLNVYKARTVTIAFDGSLHEPGKVQIVLGALGDEHYPDVPVHRQRKTWGPDPKGAEIGRIPLRARTITFYYYSLPTSLHELDSELLMVKLNDNGLEFNSSYEFDTREDILRSSPAQASTF